VSVAVRRTNSVACSPAAQYAALPWRKSRDNTIEILLVTTRRTGRWIVPKGWPIAGCSPSKSAAREAFEEAGVVGVIASEPLGSFPYDKARKAGGTVRCRVEVFALKVTQQRRSWPEKTLRQTRWCAADEALALAGDKGLRRVIAKFAEGSGAGRKHTADRAAA
jgi:8-oxo-dGTP pyrophosphatase MutT (NUDIX family)